MKKILIVMGRYLPGYKDGGPVQSIKNMTDRLGEEYEFRILTTDRDHGDKAPYSGIWKDRWNRIGKAQVWYVSPKDFSLQIICRLAASVDLVYVCGCFNDYARKVLFLKKIGKVKIPVVVAPMGLFSPGAFRQGILKKKLYILMCKKLGWFQKVEWSVTGELEREDVNRIIGRRAKCHTAQDIPKTVDKEWIPLSKKEGTLKVIFLSRISPKKNLDYALDVVKNIKGDIQFDIYGMLENQEYHEFCQQKIKELPSNIRCTYLGEVKPEEVVPLFSKYHLFLFPTKGENYGHVIYEAMAGGCIPVISDKTYWQELHRAEAGFIIPLEKPEEWAGAVQRMAYMDEGKYLEWRRRTVDYFHEYQKSIDCSGYRAIFELAGKKEF